MMAVSARSAVTSIGIVVSLSTIIFFHGHPYCPNSAHTGMPFAFCRGDPEGMPLRVFIGSAHSGRFDGEERRPAGAKCDRGHNATTAIDATVSIALDAGPARSVWRVQAGAHVGRAPPRGRRSVTRWAARPTDPDPYARPTFEGRPKCASEWSAVATGDRSMFGFCNRFHPSPGSR